MIRNACVYLPILTTLLAFSFAGNRSAGQSPPSFPKLPDNAMIRESAMIQDSPEQDSPEQDSTEQDTIELGADSGTQKKIRDVLQGHQPAPTGDGVLEDVLGVIQTQGSVLDGSLLDAPPLDGGSIASHPKFKSNSVARRALVAEQLLCAARMLEQISDDESNTALIASMRLQAGRLLVTREHRNP